MDTLKLVYFDGCPNFKVAKEALKEARLSFEEIKQDGLPKDDPLRNFSSPTILKNNVVVFGTWTGANGGCSFGTLSAEDILQRLTEVNPADQKKTKLLASTGSFGSIITVVLCPVCKPAIAAFLSSAGLGFMIHEGVLRAILLAFLAIALIGLFWSYLKVHRRIAPFIFGTVMAIGLYLGRYVYFGYETNAVLTYGSIAGLIAVSIWNLRLKKTKACCAR